MRSDRSTVRTCERRASEAACAASSSAACRSRERRIRSACSLFCSCDFSFWQLTTSPVGRCVMRTAESVVFTRSEEHTSELQSRQYLVCRLLLEKKKKQLARADLSPHDM